MKQHSDPIPTRMSLVKKPAGLFWTGIAWLQDPKTRLWFQMVEPILEVVKVACESTGHHGWALAVDVARQVFKVLID